MRDCRGPEEQSDDKKKTMDQNGESVTQSIRKETAGWGVNVWFGTKPATTIRRYYYRTRAQARQADISDEIGERGRIDQSHECRRPVLSRPRSDRESRDARRGQQTDVEWIEDQLNAGIEEVREGFAGKNVHQIKADLDAMFPGEDNLDLAQAVLADVINTSEA